MDGARQQFDGTLQMVPHLDLMGGPFPRTSKWAMSKDLELEYLDIFIKVGLGMSRTDADSQWNPVYNVFHQKICFTNETICP